MTATATDSAGNTSEFSPCEQIGGSETVALTSSEDCVSDTLGGRAARFDELTAGSSAAEAYATLGLHFVDDGVDARGVHDRDP